MCVCMCVYIYIYIHTHVIFTCLHEPLVGGYHRKHRSTLTAASRTGSDAGLPPSVFIYR